MEHPGFFKREGPFSIARVAEAAQAQMQEGQSGLGELHSVRPLALADATAVSFFDNRKYLDDLQRTQAAACFVKPNDAAKLPAGTMALITKQPYHAFARALHLFYPTGHHSQVYAPSGEAIAPVRTGADAGTAAALIHPDADIEEGAIIEPGAVIGCEAQVGRGARITAGAVVGYRCCVGRNSYVGPGASVVHALIGDRVIIHAGVRVGQDGFGFALGAGGHIKVPQIGRVVIQDDVEIGANSSIDRGALEDTIIGQGTKIDNLVQIGHNVVTGRGCVIVAMSGIAGSTTLGDGVIMGAASGIAGHVKIGNGVQIAGASHVKDDLEDGAIVGGTPARPFRDWAREIAALRKLGMRAHTMAKRKS
ncbi:MAG: UDP-3-O-(3-hydroxymyristoyl)glucosamine N-acyltransferase [Pseudomonadota bacterium]